MRLILKFLAAPIAMALTIVTALFSFLLSVTDGIIGLASTVVFIAAVILLASGQTLGGISFMAIAFLVSPFGLPALARRLVRRLDGLGSTLRGFIFG